MKGRAIKASAKQVRSLIGRTNMYNSDVCEQCGNEVDISELNILTGKCTTCEKTPIDKLKKLMGKVK